MRLFLRYQISGTIFIIWFLLFYKIETSSSLDYIIERIVNSGFETSNLLLFGFASPLGAMIHQISVNIKNGVVGKYIKELDDYPKCYIKGIEYNDKEKYILEKISNLNSFYYVRVDNGFLAPFLALITNLLIGNTPNSYLILVSFVIGVLMLCYIPRIVSEIKEYEEILNKKAGKT